MSLLKRIGYSILSMAVIMTVGFLAYSYVVPFVLSGEATEMFAGVVVLFSDGISHIDDMSGGSISSTTDTITGRDSSDMDAIPSDRNIAYPLGAIKGKIHKVVDGDTLDIGNKRIRLTLVNTPERDEAGYREAVDFTKRNCPVGTQAIYKPDSGQPDGSYGRVIAKVWCEKDGQIQEQSLNELLMRSGNAEILEQFCKTSEFASESWATTCHNTL